MNRRNALKNMGMAMGYAVATPAVLSILQSCKQEPNLAWVPQFFSVEEASVVEGLIDLILPKTDTPGAKELNVAMFIDGYTQEVAGDEDQEESKKGVAATLKELGKANASTEKYDAILSKYLKASDSDNEAFSEEEKLVSDFVHHIRGMAVWGFKTSEQIGENVMAYDPVPGSFKGCESLDELTGGKAWSL